MTAATTVVDRTEASRFEILSEGELAGFIDYVREPDHVVLTHIEIVPAFEGQGIASALARGVVGDLRARGAMVDPQCPYMARWFAKHPEHSDLVVATSRPAPDGHA